jgi:hypothetical protein
MKKEIILAHLSEAKEELDGMLAEIEGDSDFDLDGYYVSFQHVYHHLNTAWNSRKESDSRMKNCTEEDFMRWRKFPIDFDLNT